MAPWKAKNLAVAKFLNTAPAMAFGGDKKNEELVTKIGDTTLKLQSNTGLIYENWRYHILTALTSKFQADDEPILDDDLHVMEDIDIAGKQSLDISYIHVYLHNLQNWYGTGQETGDPEKFIMHIQYGKLNKRNGKFEVLKETRDDEIDTVKDGPNLQMFYNF